MVGRCDIAVRWSVPRLQVFWRRLSGLVRKGFEGLDWALGVVGVRSLDVGNVLILGGLRIGKACSRPGRVQGCSET